MPAGTTTGSGSGEIRLWKKPAGAERPIVEQHAVWSPALDGPVAVAPDGTAVVTADRSGHVHILPSGAGPISLADAAEDVSYIGHEGDVRHLAISPSAGLVASTGDDGKLRFWHLDSGLPTSEVVEISGGRVTRMVFSESGSQLAVLSDNKLMLFDVLAASLVQEFDFLESQNDLVFVGETRLYLAGANGNLQSLTRGGAGQWNATQVWNGDAAVTHLVVSPDRGLLVLSDAEHNVFQINLETSQLKPRSLSLPSRVLDLSFAPIGSRVLIRTERWMHQASASPSGLIWSDAIFLPRVAGNANTAFKRAEPGSFYLPVAVGGRVRLERFTFSDRDGEGLFGNQAELLGLWSARFGFSENSP